MGSGSSGESGAAEVIPAVEVIVGGVEAAVGVGGSDHGDVAEDEETLQQGDGVGDVGGAIVVDVDTVETRNRHVEEQVPEHQDRIRDVVLTVTVGIAAGEVAGCGHAVAIRILQIDQAIAVVVESVVADLDAVGIADAVAVAAICVAIAIVINSVGTTVGDRRIFLSLKRQT